MPISGCAEDVANLPKLVADDVELEDGGRGDRILIYYAEGLSSGVDDSLLAKHRGLDGNPRLERVGVREIPARRRIQVKSVGAGPGYDKHGTVRPDLKIDCC